MKVSIKDKTKTITTLLCQLPPRFETAISRERVKGKDLKKRGQEKDGHRKWLLDNKIYFVEREIQVPINHSRRLSKIIDAAKDFSSMTTALSEYIKKYGFENEPA